MSHPSSLAAGHRRSPTWRVPRRPPVARHDQLRRQPTRRHRIAMDDALFALSLLRQECDDRRQEAEGRGQHPRVQQNSLQVGTLPSHGVSPCPFLKSVRPRNQCGACSKIRSFSSGVTISERTDHEYRVRTDAAKQFILLMAATGPGPDRSRQVSSPGRMARSHASPLDSPAALKLDGRLRSPCRSLSSSCLHTQPSLHGGEGRLLKKSEPSSSNRDTL